MKKRIKSILNSFLKTTRIYPSVWMLGNPLKIYEFRKLIDPIDFKKTDVVVDIGCGKGYQTQIVAKKAKKVIGLEILETQYKNALAAIKGSTVEKKVEYILKPLEKANIGTESIDKIVSFCVLEHITNLEEVLNEAYKILKHGGELHATVDSLANIKDEKMIEKHRKDHFVHQYFIPQTINSTLEAAGFKIIESYPIFTSEFSRKLFINRIIENNPQRGMFKKIDIVKNITKEEELNPNPENEGIMVLVRAVKK